MATATNTDDILDNILGSSAKDAAAEVATAGHIVGNYPGAWTFSKHNEEKGSFSFGFFINEIGKLVFVACGAPELHNQKALLAPELTYWTAMKRETGVGNLLKFVIMLYQLGIMDKDGNAVASFRKRKGASVFLRCTSKDGNQQVDVSRWNGASAVYEEEKLKLLGLDKMEELFDKIDDSVLKRCVELWEAEQIVVVAPREYLCTVQTSIFNAEKKTWFGVFETTAGKCRLGLNLAYEKDVSLFQALVKMLGRDFKAHKGMKLYALIGSDETKVGREYNTLETVRVCNDLKEESTPTHIPNLLTDSDDAVASAEPGEFD